MSSAHGNVSIGAPPVNGNPSDSWCVSSAMTASKLIAILSLSKTIASVQNLDVAMDTWSQGYCRAVQDTVGSKFCPSSLSYLAKYWQDPQGKLSNSCPYHGCHFLTYGTAVLLVSCSSCHTKRKSKKQRESYCYLPLNECPSPRLFRWLNTGQHSVSFCAVSLHTLPSVLLTF